MKLLTTLFTLATVLLTTTAKSAPVPFRGPPISPAFYSNLTAWDSISRTQSYPKLLVRREAGRSDPYSSIQNTKSYFAVFGRSLPGGGTILRIDAMATTTGGVSFGALVFRDVLLNTNYTAALTRVGSSDSRTYDQYGYIADFYHTGTFTISNEIYRVKISYLGTPLYPSVQITWGNGAGFGDVGTINDDFGVASIETTPAPVNMSVQLEYVHATPSSPPTVHVGVWAPNENYTVETSTDLRAWVDGPPAYFYYGYIGYHRYPLTNGAPHTYFRSRR